MLVTGHYTLPPFSNKRFVLKSTAYNNFQLFDGDTKVYQLALPKSIIECDKIGYVSGAIYGLGLSPLVGNLVPATSTCKHCNNKKHVKFFRLLNMESPVAQVLFDGSLLISWSDKVTKYMTLRYPSPCFVLGMLHVITGYSGEKFSIIEKST